MLKLGIGIDVTTKRITASAFDPDAQAFFNRVTAAGGTLTTTEQNAVNTLVLDMKGFGIWTSMQAIYPMVGSSAAACAQNLKSSSFTGTFTSGWTFASTGATPNGTSAYFDTTLIPSTNLSQNNAHISYYSRTNTTSSAVDIGTQDLNKQIYVVYNFGSQSYTAVNDTGFLLPSAYPNTLSLVINSRINSNQHKSYKSGSLFATVTINSNSQSTRSIYLGASNNTPTGAAQFSTKQCAFASIGDGLTDTQASNYYIAVQAFQTSLSRQV
jgi:hypothetical protein